MKRTIRRVISLTVYTAVIVAASFGLALFSKWFWLPSGSSLSQNQVRDATDFTMTFGVGFSLGEIVRQRSKPKKSPAVRDEDSSSFV